jgi:cellobiose transport system permease protein
METVTRKRNPKANHIHYEKWGYLFLIPFFLVFLLFQLWPLLQTLHFSWYEYYDDMLTTVGPNWCGFQNFAYLFTTKTIRPLLFLFGSNLAKLN